jgi:hypothetical protein
MMSGGAKTAYRRSDGLVLLRGSASFGNQIVSGMAGGLASAASRSIIDGTSFGDNLLAALPDVVGSTLGNMLVARLNGVRDEVIGRSAPSDAPPPPPSTGAAEAAAPAGAAPARDPKLDILLQTADPAKPIRIRHYGGDPLKIAAVLGQIPMDLRTFIGQQNISYAATAYSVTEYVNDKGQSYVSGEPHNHPAGSKFSTTRGVFEAFTNTVVMATEGQKDAAGNITYGAGGSIDALLHETGHAVDYALGGRRFYHFRASQNSDFRDAYKEARLQPRIDPATGQPMVDAQGNPVMANTFAGVANDYFDITNSTGRGDRTMSIGEAYAEAFAAYFHPTTGEATNRWNSNATTHLEWPQPAISGPTTQSILAGRPSLRAYWASWTPPLKPYGPPPPPPPPNTP